jgi:hypothetical protein
MMSDERDQVQPVSGFDPKTQKQVLCTIWRPTTRTFQIILETIPRATSTQAKSCQETSTKDTANKPSLELFASFVLLFLDDYTE